MPEGITGDELRQMTPEQKLLHYAQIGEWPMVQQLIRDEHLNLTHQQMGKALGDAYDIAAGLLDSAQADPQLARFADVAAEFGLKWRNRAQLARTVQSRDDLVNLVLEWFT